MTEAILFQDIETTGFDRYRNTILVWAGVFTDLNLNILEKKEIRFRPMDNEVWDDGAEEIHGISSFEAYRYDSKENGLSSMLSTLGKYKIKEAVEHSKNKFDSKFLMAFFDKSDMIFELRKHYDLDKVLSTVKIAKEAGYKKNGLKDWAKRIGFHLDHHDAMSDTLCCLEVYKFLTGKSNIKIRGDVSGSSQQSFF